MRGAIVSAVLVACGHASAPPPSPRAIASGPLHGPADAGPPDANEPDPLLPSNMQPKPPLTYADAVQHVATPTGPMPGVPSIAILRVPDPTRCGGEALVTIFAPGGKDEPLLVLGLASSSAAPATVVEAKAWLTSTTDRARRAAELYQRRANAATGRDHVEAEAYYVEVERHRADAALHMRPFRGIYGAGTRGFQPFCDGLAKSFEPDIDDADTLAATCRTDAAAAGITSGWILDACRAP